MAFGNPTRFCTAAIVALAVLGAGCTPVGSGRSAWHDPYPLPADTLTVPTAEMGTHGGRFVIAQTAPPKTFNPLMATESSSRDITNLLFVGLAELDNATQRIYPLLARSWESSEDGLTWTWRLRRGACFSDGHPITSADVLFSFEVLYDRELHPSLQDIIAVQGKPFEVSAPDSYTVVTRSAAPHALTAAIVGALRILPRHILEPAYRRGEFASAYGVATAPESLVTSGAFQLVQYAGGEKVVLGRNPYWFGVDARGQRLPYLDELVFVIVTDQDAAVAKFEGGEIDAVDNVKPADYKLYTDGAARGGYTLYDLGPSLTTTFMWFNLNRGHVPAKHYRWFANRAFRRAVSQAIDREAMIRGPYFGEAVKNWSHLTASSRDWNPVDVERHDYDPKEAVRLLDSLGYRDRDGDGMREDDRGEPIRFTLKTNSDNNVRVALATLIQDDLARVGIRCTPAPIQLNTLTTNVREDFDYDAMLLGLGSGVPADPAMTGNFLLSSGASHYWNVRQPEPTTAAEREIDRLYRENVGEFDPALRQQTWRRMANVLNGEDFVIWLPVQKIKIPIRNGFGNIHPTVLPHRILWNIDRVFVKNGKRV